MNTKIVDELLKTQIYSMKKFEFCSADSWNLVCSIEAVGQDLLCRIHGGDSHVGAVALGEWKDDRAVTGVLVADGHREDKIAVHAAHRLCGASRRQVVCLSGIHFDNITDSQIREITQSGFLLTRKAAKVVEESRLKADVSASKLLSRIEERATEISEAVESFLTTPWERLIELHASGAARSFSKNFGDRVTMFAPLYLSNACLNNCVYCGFRHSARFKRRTLTSEEAVREAAFLADRGFRVLDLVTGEVPTDKFVGYVCQIIEAILDGTAIRSVNLNIGSLSTDQYQRLRQSGATGYHLYQESYDPAVFFEVHESGRKRDMAARLDGLHRAIGAGFDRVGLGILLGLGNPVDDLARMVSHAEIIRTDFPKIKLGFSLPRVRQVDEGCSYEPHSMIPDEAFMKYMLFLRLRFPDAHLTLTTREGESVRDSLLPLGITKVSAEVSTSPGGYTNSADTETDQFSISDGRTLEEMRKVIESVRLVPSVE